jgi:hypothetical protein
LAFSSVYSPVIFTEINFMKIYLPALMILLAYACGSQKPIAVEQPRNNATYQVDYLFEHDGCKVYRFYDRGNYIYFTNCNGEAITKTDSTEIRNRISLTKNKPANQ